MLIEEVFTRHGLGMDYDISQDKDYLHLDYNESSAALYDYIKSKAISTFCQLRHTRHAVVMNTHTHTQSHIHTNIIHAHVSGHNLKYVKYMLFH